MRHAPVRTSLLVVGALGGLLALAGCGIPTVPTTSTHAPVGPTPTVIHAQTATHTIDAAPPWTGLPLRTRTSAGTPGDPVNVAFEGSKSTIVAAFKKIGWVQADPLSVENDVRLAKDTLAHKSYPKAPVSTLYLSGRPQDFAVEKEVGSVAQRDHARLWDTHRTDAKTHLELWIADAARDIKIEVVRKHGVPAGTTHRIGPDVDAERRRIVSGLQGQGVVAAVVMEPGIGKTTDGRNGENDRFYTDGKAAVIVLDH